MTFFMLVFVILGIIPFSFSGLLSPCGNGCSVRISPLTNELHCDCSGRTAIQDSKTHHHKPDHEHHHAQHETTSQSTNSPQTTKSLCEPGCQLRLQPFHFCVCNTPTTAAASHRTTLSRFLKVDLPTTQFAPGTQTVAAQFTTDAQNAAVTSPSMTTNSITTHLATTSTTKVPVTTPNPITPSTYKTTTHVSVNKVTNAPTQNICDILCAQQLGGDACHCSKPGLPG